VSSPSDQEAIERLAYDDSARDVASARRVAIAVVVIGAALVAGLARTWWAYLLAIGSLVAVRFWAQRVVAARTEERSLAGTSLELGPEQIAIPRHGRPIELVAWSDLERVEVDHEKLLVVLRTRTGSEVEIEPTFGGLGLEGLAQRIEGRRPR